MNYARVHPTSSRLDKGGQHCPTASHTWWATYALYSEFSCLLNIEHCVLEQSTLTTNKSELPFETMSVIGDQNP